NQVLIVGGTSGGTVAGSAEAFVPWAGTNGMFATTGSPSMARSGAAGAAMGVDGVYLMAGGANASGTQMSSEVYRFATVKTDKDDYPPYSVVTITGSGWQPGETVTLTLVEDPDYDSHPPISVVADANGNFVNTDFSP